MNRTMVCRLTQRREFRLRIPNDRRITLKELSGFHFEFFRRVLQIFYAIGFTAQLRAENAIVTTGAVVAPRAQGAILSIDAVAASIALLEIQTLIATPATNPYAAIETVRALLQAGDEAAILVVVAGEEQVAVLVIAAHIGVVAVLILEVRKIATWDAVHQFSDLPEKGMATIKRFAIGKRIPPISPPLLLLIHGELRAGGIHGNDFLPRRIAFPLIERPFVTEREPSLLPTIGAKSWRRNQLLLSRKQRRKLLEKREIGRHDLESSRALLTGFLHVH